MQEIYAKIALKSFKNMTAVALHIAPEPASKEELERTLLIDGIYHQLEEAFDIETSDEVLRDKLFKTISDVVLISMRN